MRENRASHHGRMKNSSYYIDPVRDRTHDPPHTVASNMVHVSHAVNHSATAAVVTSDHVTKCFYSLLLELHIFKAVRLPFLALLHFFSFLSTIYHHLPICPHFKRFQLCHISSGYCPHLTVILLVDHTYAFIIIFLVFIHDIVHDNSILH